MIAGSGDEYVNAAVRLATDLKALAELRAGLRERMRGSPLCDPHRAARAVEAAYRAMWATWCGTRMRDSLWTPRYTGETRFAVFHTEGGPVVK